MTAPPDRHQSVKARLSQSADSIRQRKRLRIIAPELLADAVAEAGLLLLQLLGDPRPFAQFNHDGIGQMRGAKAGTIGAQRIAQDPAVQPIVLGAHDRKPVAEAIELLRVDRKDRKAALQKGFNHRPMRRLDGDRNRRRHGPRRRQQPITKGAKAGTAMGKKRVPQSPYRGHPVRPKGASRMPNRRPHTIPGHQPCPPPLHDRRGTTTTADPCTGAQSAPPHRAFHRGQPAGALVPPGARGTGGKGSLPAGRPVPEPVTDEMNGTGGARRDTDSHPGSFLKRDDGRRQPELSNVLAGIEGSKITSISVGP
jgi:hypothetical protein